MLFILQVSILSEQTVFLFPQVIFENGQNGMVTRVARFPKLKAAKYCYERLSKLCKM